MYFGRNNNHHQVFLNFFLALLLYFALLQPRNNAIPVGQEPMKAYGDGVQMGLTVLLDAQIDDYALTSSFYRGFKVPQTHLTMATMN